MTDWGLNDCRSDPQNGAYGGMIEKLIRNNLSVFFLSSILTRLTAELESYVPPPQRPNQYVFNDCALLCKFVFSLNRFISVVHTYTHTHTLILRKHYTIRCDMPQFPSWYPNTRTRYFIKLARQRLSTTHYCLLLFPKWDITACEMVKRPLSTRFRVCTDFFFSKMHLPHACKIIDQDIE